MIISKDIGGDKYNNLIIRAKFIFLKIAEFQPFQAPVSMVSLTNFNTKMTGNHTPCIDRLGKYWIVKIVKQESRPLPGYQSLTYFYHKIVYIK